MHNAELSLADYLQIFLRRSWVIVLTTILCVVAAFTWTAQQTPLYESSATVLINQANAADLFDPVGTGNAYSYAERLAATEARFLTSGIVAEEAIERLGYEAYISVSEDDFADVLIVSATSPDPARAQQIAQTYSEAYVDVREQRFRSERTSTANQLAERLAEIDLNIANAEGEDRIRLEALRSNVAQSLDLLTLTADLAEGSGTIVIDNAFLPNAPFTPRNNRNLALGAILGLMSGAGLVLLIEALDRSVKTREALELITPGAPNLAVIPTLGKSLERTETLVAFTDPTGPSAEAFRTLRAALQYVSVDENARVILIASAHSAAGKTTVAANLAITLAQSGQRVVVIDADLRRPRLHQLFDVPQVPGLTSAIIGTSPLAECFHRMDTDGRSPFVLPSGPIPPGPAELLGSSAGERAIELIRDLADYVIIDTPPVLPVADTVVLSRYVDASILVVDASKTKRADVIMAFERLAQAGAPVIGTVLNKVKRRSLFGGYGYGYGYGYGGYQPDGAEGKAGLVGWFSKNAEGNKIERLHGSDIPLLRAAASKGKPPASAASSAKNGLLAPDDDTTGSPTTFSARLQADPKSNPTPKVPTDDPKTDPVTKPPTSMIESRADARRKAAAAAVVNRDAMTASVPDEQDRAEDDGRAASVPEKHKGAEDEELVVLVPPKHNGAELEELAVPVLGEQNGTEDDESVPAVTLAVDKALASDNSNDDDDSMWADDIGFPSAEST